MIHIVKKGALLTLVGGLALPVAAQTSVADWRPFRVGHTYYYAAGAGQDSIISTRLLSVPIVSGGDTTWTFQPVLRRVAPNSVTGGCPPVPLWRFGYTHRERPDIEFGQRITSHSDGSYTLQTSTGQALRLKPRQPIGLSWPAANGLTATVTARTVARVALAVPTTDSVVTIDLSSGHQLVLSKQFGLVSAPDVEALLSGRGVVPSLVLHSLPIRGLGLPPNHPWIVYDFQPGDEFGYEGETTPASNPNWVCERSYLRVKVLSRTLSLGGDTLRYTLRQQTRDEKYYSPTNPYCIGPDDTVLISPIETIDLILPLKAYNRPNLIAAPRESTLSIPALPELIMPAQMNMGTRRDSVFAGCWSRRYVTLVRTSLLDPCTNAFGNDIDGLGAQIKVANGLGWVGRSLISSSSYSHQELAWWVKDGVSCGNATGFPIGPLGATALLPASAVQLYPNPATTTARLHLTGTKGGALTLTATDALGRRVWQHTQVVGAEADIALPVAAWAPGVYYVRVALGEGARVVRVVKE